jgi:hypothetical protein
MGAEDQRGMGIRTPHADDPFCIPGSLYAPRGPEDSTGN